MSELFEEQQQQCLCVHMSLSNANCLLTANRSTFKTLYGGADDYNTLHGITNCHECRIYFFF